ncbi:copper amine oxidase N-terminal domain-containing protein [Ammoniphilus sp. CFH 90114]|uniref:copper amine oxidase N-terminal domain-containing protein n=1 Tax=Ammoniphilus sp. CFH 90114 TaxID=2493665 RepID=UPI00100F052F|nr:copper amine oxidase N-terminal domain-containing protein [Ammoniphilus sp. CFH 90114]RXT03886.1 copper amine oxidase N-terminal domain-containing protein [Ammoniphilus sp. CFH 90114]
MKHLIKKMVVASLLASSLSAGPVFSTSSQDVKVNIDGELQQFNPPAILRGGKTYVPLRAVFEELGAEVEWDAKNREVHITKDGVKSKLYIPTYIQINGRLMIPLRKVSEELGAGIAWDANTRTVLINSDGSQPQVTPVQNATTRKWKTIEYKNQEFSAVSKTAWKSDGTLLVGTDKGVWKQVNGKWSPLGNHKLFKDWITYLEQGKDGRLLAIEGHTKLWIFDNDSWEQIQLPEVDCFICGKSIWRANFSTEGEIVVEFADSNYPGLGSYKDGKWSQYEDDALVDFYTIDSMNWLPDGTMWTTSVDGLLRRIDGKWAKFPVPEGSLPDYYISTSQSGKLALGTHANGMFVLENDQWIRPGGASYPTPLKDRGVRLLAWSNDDVLAVQAHSLYGNVWIFKDGSWTEITAGSPIAAQEVFELYWTPSGQLELWTDSSGIWLYDLK